MNDNLGQDLLRYTYKNKIFNTFDSETESLNLRFSRPWSFAWIISKGDEIVDKQDRYLWWGDLAVSSGAAAITKFNYSLYKDKAEDPKKVFQELEPYLFSPEVTNVAHNGIGLDFFAIDAWRRGIGLKTDFSYQKHYLDTNCIAKAVKLSLQPQKPMLIWQYKLNSIIKKGLKTNLTLLSKEYNLNVDENNFHGASFDAEITRQVLLRQMWQIEI